jgi:hypothetical protein
MVGYEKVSNPCPFLFEMLCFAHLILIKQFGAPFFIHVPNCYKKLLPLR